MVTVALFSTPITSADDPLEFPRCSRECAFRFEPRAHNRYVGRDLRHYGSSITTRVGNRRKTV